MHKVPHIRLRAILAVFFMFHAAAAGAGEWETVCEPYERVPVPEADRPSIDEREVLEGCSSEALYYGIGQNADPEKARKCAYLELEQDGGKVFSGPSMLMTIYANGKGATRNYDLAMKFACVLDGAPAEMDGRIENLLTKKESNWTGEDFHLCDDITSGFMMGICTAHQAQFEEQEQEQRWRELMAGWNPSERAAFEVLRQAANGFFDLRADNEVDQSGTGRVMFYMEERQSLEDGFLSVHTLLEGGEFPVFTPSRFKEADKELNSVYRKIHKMPNFQDGYGTITQNGIRETQRAWIVYRDALAAFAKVRYKTVTPESVMGYLTQERTEMLQEFLSY